MTAVGLVYLAALVGSGRSLEMPALTTTEPEDLAGVHE